MSGSARLEQAEIVIRDAVLSRRELGMKVAIQDVATLFGLSPRRVKGLVYGELTALWPTEWDAIRARYGTWCDAEIQRLNERAAVVQARRDGMRTGG